MENEKDPHSFAEPEKVVVTHLDLDAKVDFDKKQIAGLATLRIDNKTKAQKLHLDTRDLNVYRVTLGKGDTETKFSLGDEVEFMGRPLIVDIQPDTTEVNVYYNTNPAAAALQWLEPAQTAGGKKPFLFTQSQAILARTWVPCQDSPGVRMTYRATIRTRPDLLAVMSAKNSTQKNADGLYVFEMPQPVPSYLLALAVGDIDFRPLGDRTGVYAEPSVVDKAANEFADLEKMMAAAESLYDPYRWERYDVIVLPPSFPFGGMENPRLTFATPTILAGDRSLVSLIAHELAHSWSGNLVTNANWNDFWLNEGFTVYLERRIMEAIKGRDYSEMLAQLGHQDMTGTIEELGADSKDTHLHLDLAGRDPDEGMTDVAYEKGYFFLRLIEESAGRERFDAFLRKYFDTFAFKSMTTTGFLSYLQEHLIADDGVMEQKLQIDKWIYGAGVPASCPKVESKEFAKVEEQVKAWQGGAAAKELKTAGWTSHHWLHFLRKLDDPISQERMAELDAAFKFSNTGNSEILNAWLMHAISNKYELAYPSLERFLTSMGRRKFLKPLYTELAKTPEGLEMAREIYRKARPTYHSVSYNTVDEILKWKG
ncbi:MAG: M1 family metallopeptidase [Blastocatellia bacterium]|nr:M1 family metallopeptidase [Blastocatellia bacterium]